MAGSLQNTEDAFEKIHAIALLELNRCTHPTETVQSLEDIIALARYKFNVTIQKTTPRHLES